MQFANALIHAATKRARNHAVGANDMNRATPTTDTIPVNTCEQTLRQRLKQLLGLHVGLVQALRNAVQLLRAAAADCKIFREASRAKKVSSPKKGVFSSSRPATTGSQKYRPKRLPYCMEEMSLRQAQLDDKRDRAKKRVEGGNRIHIDPILEKRREGVDVGVEA